MGNVQGQHDDDDVVVEIVADSANVVVVAVFDVVFRDTDADADDVDDDVDQKFYS